MKTAMLAILSTALAAGIGCRGNDLGTGANTVEREYARPAAEVWTAALKSAESADLRILNDRHDRLGGDLIAERGNGNSVRILVKSLDEKNSHVSVRVEPGDRDLANLLQERIAARVGLGEATTGIFGGNSLDGTYAADLDSCMTSARRVYLVLKVTATDEESHPTWSKIDGRLKDSTPVRIRMEKTDDACTRVTFIAGNSKSEDNKAFAQKMKDEFESTTRPGGGGR